MRGGRREEERRRGERRGGRRGGRRGQKKGKREEGKLRVKLKEGGKRVRGRDMCSCLPQLMPRAVVYMLLASRR